MSKLTLKSNSRKPIVFDSLVPLYPDTEGKNISHLICIGENISFEGSTFVIEFRAIFISPNGNIVAIVSDSNVTSPPLQSLVRDFGSIKYKDLDDMAMQYFTNTKLRTPFRIIDIMARFGLLGFGDESILEKETNINLRNGEFQLVRAS